MKLSEQYTVKRPASKQFVSASGRGSAVPVWNRVNGMSGKTRKSGLQKKPEVRSDSNVISLRRKSGKTRRKPHTGRQRIAFIVIIVLMLIILFSMNNIIRLKQQEHETQQEVASLKAQKAELEARVEEIDSNDYIEQQARNWLKMAKQGDRVYVLNGDSILQGEGITHEQEAAEASKHQKAADQGL